MEIRGRRNEEAWKEDISIDNHNIALGEQSTVRIGVGRLPSDTRIFITAHIYRSKNPGPTLLLLGGVHGDEINGVETLRRVIESGSVNKLEKGSVIIIPLLNVFGFINFSRDVPDGKDVNRSFPGNTRGSLASRVARVITKKFLPHVDFAIDCHTGGASRYNYPQVRFTSRDVQAAALAKAFRAPFIIEKAMIRNSFRRITYDLGIPVIVYEGGESVRLDGFSIREAREGIERVMQRLSMLPDDGSEKKNTPIFVRKTNWLRAPYSGIFLWSKSSGQEVEKGEIIGSIKDPFGLKSVSVSAKTAGYIIGHNNASVVNHGDALFHIAYDYDEMDID